MNRLYLIVLIALICRPMGVFSLEQKDFDAAVDFSKGFKEIMEIVQPRNFDPAKNRKFLVFDGSVATITVMEKEPSSFTAELEIIGGEWQGTENVTVYRAFVYVQGKEFADRLPERPPKVAPPGLISQNDHILIVGRIEDVYVDDEGKRIPVILADYIRTIR